MSLIKLGLLGAAGYGLYTHDDYRIDPHDPEDEQA